MSGLLDAVRPVQHYWSPLRFERERPVSIPSFAELHQVVGELVVLMFEVFGAAEVFLWHAKKLKKLWREFKSDN